VPMDTKAYAGHRPFAVAVRDLITGPLKLRDAGFSVTDRSRLATPYFTRARWGVVGLG